MKRRELLTKALGPAMPDEKAGELKPKKSGPGTKYFPNFLMRTHEGKEVRFYDDLIHGKHVVINMMYADCEGICPTMTSNLVKVQQILGDRVGRDVFMYSITLRPEKDTPEVLNHYVKMHGVKPGWVYLTGKAADIEVLRRRLGFVDPDPKLDKDNANHIGVVRIGNDVTDVWIATPVISKPSNIAKRILWLETPKDYQADNGGAHVAKSPDGKNK